MQIVWYENAVKFIREENDPKFYGIRFAKGEHNLFHFLKEALNAEGNDFIKKRAQKDGHMLGDEFQPYLRTRSPRSRAIRAPSSWQKCTGSPCNRNTGRG